MTASASRRRRRPRGNVEELPSGALRVSAYAGIDPLTKRRHYLRETIPAGPGSQAEAEKVLRRLAGQVDEQRNPRTSATVDQLLDRHFDLLDIEPDTVENYRRLARLHVRPLIGGQKVGALDADLFDSFYAELRRCRDHCDKRPHIQHRTAAKHDCDDRCRPHECRPLAASSIRQIHFMLSGALKRAVRWRWIATSPIAQAQPPAKPAPNPQPPSPDEAAQILNAAWRDPDWGLLVWLAMVTGGRRGELCALRWQHVDLGAGVLTLARNRRQRGGRTWEKDTKTHQSRRIALDPDTVALLGEYRERCERSAAAVELPLRPDAFVFSRAVDGATPLLPDSVSQRYAKLVARLRIKTSIHKLRHYSATELIAAGVDVRTVAGRLGHSGGGTTTLKVYSAWVAESDQRAAVSLFARLPQRPDEFGSESRAPAPYETIASELRGEIASGVLPVGGVLPTNKALMEQFKVSAGTAHRAVALLQSWGLVDVARGRRAVVVRRPEPELEPALESEENPATLQSEAANPGGSSRLWEVVVRGPEGRRYAPRHVNADLGEPERFRRHLLAIARMEAPAATDAGEGWIGEFELEVFDAAHTAQGPLRVLRWD
jgi:integrase